MGGSPQVIPPNVRKQINNLYKDGLSFRAIYRIYKDQYPKERIRLAAGCNVKSIREAKCMNKNAHRLNIFYARGSKV